MIQAGAPAIIKKFTSIPPPSPSPTSPARFTATPIRLDLNEAWDRRELPDQDPVPFAVEAQSLNHCTASEVPDLFLGICSEVSMVMADLRPEGGWSLLPCAQQLHPQPKSALCPQDQLWLPARLLLIWQDTEPQ